jgi:mannitol-specific phosphotransferase system IIBC component
MYCDTDSEGNNLCMVRKDGMTVAGTIVAVFLAVVLTAIIASIVFLCCRDRKEQKRIRARAEAAAIAKSNSVARPETRSVSQSTRVATGDVAQPNPFAG